MFFRQKRDREALAILQTSRNMLGPGSWTQGMLHDDFRGAHCALGMMQNARLAVGASKRSYKQAATILAEDIVDCQDVWRPHSRPDDIITAWNDRVGRTIEDVWAAFDSAIDYLKATLPGKHREIVITPEPIPVPDRIIHVEPLHSPQKFPEPFEEPAESPSEPLQEPVEPEKIPA